MQESIHKIVPDIFEKVGTPYIIFLTLVIGRPHVESIPDIPDSWPYAEYTPDSEEIPKHLRAV